MFVKWSPRAACRIYANWEKPQIARVIAQESVAPTQSDDCTLGPSRRLQGPNPRPHPDYVEIVMIRRSTARSEKHASSKIATEER